MSVGSRVETSLDNRMYSSPLNREGTRSKTPNGSLRPRLVPDTIYTTISLYIHTSNGVQFLTEAEEEMNNSK